ncbi:hypothetical protein ABPS01_02990 [Streptococcus sp. ZJ151]|uniref:hypothetical protein n=1 Tax=Streptococcus jiangjianxini TaxID=3161189 RepID=UPI0032EE6F07
MEIKSSVDTEYDNSGNNIISKEQTLYIMDADGIGYPAIHIDGYSGLVENLNYNNDRFTGEILQATYTGFANISKDSDTIQNVFVTRDTTMITFDESKK